MKKYALSLFIIFSSVVFPQSNTRSVTMKLEDILIEQFARYPGMEVQDMYKLVFQAAFGSYHAALDSAMAREWLDAEWVDTTPSESVPECEPINPDTLMIRVNLASYKFHGGDKEKLLRAFITTATGYKGSREVFLNYWADVIQLAENQQIPFTKIELTEYLEDRLSEGLSAVHHSKKYQNLYKPAYRVVLRSELK